MGFLQSLGVAFLLASNAHAAVSSTGFTVSLAEIDYFLPPKPIARIAGCNELESLLDDGIFAPITVVSDVADVALFAAKDDVWQEGFLEGVYSG